MGSLMFSSSKESSKTHFLNKLDTLRREYAAELPRKLEKIEELSLDLRLASTDRATNTLRELLQAVHRLTGSAESFGFEEISEKSLKFEKILAEWHQSSHRLGPEEFQTMEFHIFELRYSASLIHVPPSAGPTVEPSTVDREQRSQNRRIFLVDPSKEFLTELEEQLTFYGFQIEAFTELDVFSKAVILKAPDLILINVAFPEGNLAGIEIFDRLKSRICKTPVLFLSDHEDLTARLMCVRMGGHGFFLKPIEMDQLIDSVDELTWASDTEKYRVFVVEDDESIAMYYKLILQSHDMEVMVVHEPSQLLERLVEFNPDLVLLDYYLPGCTGLEIAKVIRQQPRFLSLPLVFLSTEANLNKHLDALSAGAEDFIIKPVSTQHLVVSVQARIQRAKRLKSLMIMDSLTGLFDHTTLMDKLSLELSRSRRSGRPLSFAMLDLDHFKSVNDRYGHLTGDRVLRNLARILKQRLRITDIIGRYGGEEFGVILIDTDLKTAYQVMEEIRINFSKLSHHHSSLDGFRVTFSCGLAGFPQLQETHAICEVADRALYHSKTKGRNCVTVSDSELIRSIMNLSQER